MQSKTRLWASWILTALVSLLLLFSATMKLIAAPGLAEGFAQLELPIALAVPIGILELAVALTYLFPRTSVLGAILLTGYMGGAILTHLRVGDPYYMQILIGVAAWGALYLREPRLSTLIPLKS